MQNKEEKEKLHYIGRHKETDYIKKDKKPLTEEEKQHNLECMLEHYNRPRIVRGDNGSK